MTGKSVSAVAYVISAVEGFVDEATVRRYAELAGPAIEQFDGRFIVSNAQTLVVEGESPQRHLSIVQFPSIKHAHAWYDSPENAEARALTPLAFSGRLLTLVEGIKLAGDTRLQRAVRAVRGSAAAAARAISRGVHGRA